VAVPLGSRSSATLAPSLTAEWIMSASSRPKDHSITILVDKSPKEVFDGVNNVRGWWSGEITGNTDKVGEVWIYRYEDLHRSTQKVSEMIPDKRVVWHVTDSQLSSVKDKTEWNGTEIVFDISKKGARPSSVSPMSVSPRRSSATTTAPMPGDSTSGTACENSSRRGKGPRTPRADGKGPTHPAAP